MKRNEIINKLGMEDITPVHKVEGLYLKRDDLYTPFGEGKANGSKLRQCAWLVVNNLDKAKKGIITATSIHSPQGALVAELCNSINLPCTIYYGATNEERLKVLDMPRIAKKANANLEIVSKLGRHAVLYSKARKRAEETGEFVVEYGMDLKDNLDVFIESVANQVQNIPDELDNLVITCGSGISTTGILYGLKMFNKNVKKIYLVGVAPNREKKIYKNLEMLEEHYGIELSDIEFEYIDLFNTKGFRYEKQEKGEHFGVNFHPNYEAKTYNWLKGNIDYNKEKTMLWVVGNMFYE